MPPAIGGPRGQDLSKSTVARLAIGGLFVGSLLIVAEISYDNTITPRGIVIHHSSVMPAIIQLGPNATDPLPLDIDSWDQFHRIHGFSVFYWGHVYHLGYHFMIFPDGTVKQGRPEHCVGAHAKGFNSYLGIALVGDFSTKTTLEVIRLKRSLLLRKCRLLSYFAGAYASVTTFH